MVPGAPGATGPGACGGSGRVLMGGWGAGSLRNVETRARPGDSGRGGSPRCRRGGGLRVVVGLLAVLSIGLLGSVGAGVAAAQDEPEPTTPTTETPPTTAPPTTLPPTTEAPTTLPPTTEAPQPTAPPTTSGGGGGGTVRPTVPTTVATTEPPSTETTTPRSTVVAPVPGAVTVPEEAPAPADSGPSGPWLSPDTQLRIAVGGLVALAVVMLVLTAAYWRHTRPGRPTPLVGVADDARGAPTDPVGTPSAVPAEEPVTLAGLPVEDSAAVEPEEAGAIDALDDDEPVQPTVVGTGTERAPSSTAPTVGFSAAPPSALPPPDLGPRR